MMKKNKFHNKKGTNTSNYYCRINPLSDARRVQSLRDDEDGNDDDDDNDRLTLKRRKLSIIGGTNTSSSHDDVVTRNKVSTTTKTKTTTTIVTKADLKARELWHKKSGAGYDLFVQYYASQPLGIVTDDVDDDEVLLLDQNNNNKSIKKKKNSSSLCIHVSGNGQSRAAKKRRKKKGRQINNNNKPSIHGNDNDLTSHESQSQYCVDGAHHKTTSILLPELEVALKRQSNNSYHLTSFLTTMSEELPLTLRIRQHFNMDQKDEKQFVHNFKKQLNQNFSHLIQPVPYDPSNSIYQAVSGTNLTKTTLGTISPELKSIIVKASSIGLVARQELGSMLPVIALKGGNHIKYGSKVLDMCSSPGSKMLQALEIVAIQNNNNNNENIRISSSSDGGRKKYIKPGRVVSNDIHPLRLESLKDAVARSGLSNELTDRVIYTNHDASTFPTPKSGKLFDCIIADVPCSGDGTIRKDRRILSGWMPSIGNSLHMVQKKILMRALKLVKVGGVVAYSTCSLNPIEDEAVVASVLSWANNGYCKGDSKSELRVELLEWPHHVLPKLIWSKGINSWRVGNYLEENEADVKLNDDNIIIEDVDIPQLQWYDSFEDADAAKVPHAVSSMWPPSKNLVQYMNLHRCMRLRPQDNNTGGFFVALLKRLS